MADVSPLRGIRAPVQNEKKFYIHLPMLLYYFNFKFTGPVFVNQISYQICVTTLQVNRTICEKLELHENGLTDELMDLETQIQPYTTNVVMIQKGLETLIPTILSFFIGSWSDKYGRKPVFLVAHIGRAVSFLLIMIVTRIGNSYDINPYWYLMGSLGIALSGGYAINTIAMYAYVVETTDKSNRESRMGLLEGALNTGLFLGSIAASHILRWISTTVLFFIAFLLTIISVWYIAFYLHENTKPKNSLNSFKALFDFKLVADVIRACFKKRDLHNRLIIGLIFGGLLFNVFVFTGTFQIIFLFFRKQFNWSIKDFSLFEAYTTLVQAFGMFFVGYCLRRSNKIAGSTVAVIGCLSCVVYYTTLAVATQSYQIYVVETLAFLKASISPMWRALLSNVVDEHDIGKIYTFTSSLEALTPLLSAPLYGWFYKSTLTFYPGAVHLISLSLYIICAFIGITVIYIKKKFYFDNFAYKNVNEDDELFSEIM